MTIMDHLLEQTLEELERLSTASSASKSFETEVFENQNRNAQHKYASSSYSCPSYEERPDTYAKHAGEAQIKSSPTPRTSSNTSPGSTTGSIYEPLKPRSVSQISGYSQSSDTYSGSNTFRSSSVTGDYYDDECSGVYDYLPIGTCTVCHLDVLSDGSGCTAMDKIYHISCFKCHICKLGLQGKAFFAVHGRPYCEQDYKETLEKCSKCKQAILDRILRATGKPYHPACFTCLVCGNALDGIPFTVDAANNIYCITDFHKKFAPRCCVCFQPIMPQGKGETVRVVALEKSFHVSCYRCEDCSLLLGKENGCYPLDDHILCKQCNAERVQLLTEDTNDLVTEL